MLSVRKLKLKKHKIIAAAAAVILVVIDQLTKYLAATLLKGGGAVTAIPYLLDLQYSENTGMALGMLKNQRWVFMTLTVVFLCVLMYVFFSKKTTSPLVVYCITLIVSGGIGNMIDRIFLGYVIDFLDAFFMDYIFNFADCCVVVGCIALAAVILFKKDAVQNLTDGKQNENS